MLHSEAYDDAEYCYEISAAKLFRQVRDQKMPFHRWYKWLEDKFGDLREAFVAQQEAREKEIELLSKDDADGEDFGDRKKSKKKGIFGKIYRMLGKNKKSDKKKIKNAVIDMPRAKSEAA